MKEVLILINNLMNEMDIPYTFDNWDDSPLPQFVGEISEIPTLYEDGQNEYSFILTGYALEYEYLLDVSNKVKEKFKTSAIIENTVIKYENTITVDSGDDKLKQIQITLNIKDWRV